MMRLGGRTTDLTRLAMQLPSPDRTINDTMRGDGLRVRAVPPQLRRNVPHGRTAFPMKPLSESSMRLRFNWPSVMPPKVSVRPSR